MSKLSVDCKGRRIFIRRTLLFSISLSQILEEWVPQPTPWLFSQNNVAFPHFKCLCCLIDKMMDSIISSKAPSSFARPRISRYMPHRLLLLIWCHFLWFVYINCLCIRLITNYLLFISRAFLNGWDGMFHFYTPLSYFIFPLLYLANPGLLDIIFLRCVIVEYAILTTSILSCYELLVCCILVAYTTY